MKILMRRIAGFGVVAVVAAGLAGCVQAPSTIVCWEEPVASPRGTGGISRDKYDPHPAMRTVCAPVSARLPGQPHGPGGARPGPGPVPGPGPGPVIPADGATKHLNAQTYRDEDGNPLGTLAVGETVDGKTPIAGTDHRGGGAPVTYVGTLDAIKTGNDIRNEVAGLGNQIRQGVENDVR